MIKMTWIQPMKNGLNEISDMPNFQSFFIQFKDNPQELLSYRDGDQIHKVSKEEFFQLVLNVAEQLSNLKKHNLVLLSFEHSLDLFVSFFACLAQDLIPAIIAHPSSKVSSQEFFHKIKMLCQQHDPSLILACKNTKLIIEKEVEIQVLSPDLHLLNRNDISFAKNPEFTQFSSGSTGLPKAIKYNFSQLLLHINDFKSCLQIKKHAQFISWLPLYHDMGLISCFLFPILESVPIHLIDPFYWIQHPHILLEDIENCRATHTWMPNFAYKHLTKNCSSKTYNLSSMECFASCAEPIDPDTLIHFYQTFRSSQLKSSSFAITYAMAENIFAMSHGQIDMEKQNWYLRVNQEQFRKNQIVIDAQSPKKIASCGFPLKNTSIHCTSQFPNYSNVLIQSDYMAQEYWNNPVKDLLTNPYFDTKDLGFLYQNQLYICGRDSDLIISRGINIFPQEIEDFVSSQQGIYPGRVVCMGHFDPDLSTEKVILLFETKNISEQDYAILQNKISQATYLELGIIIDEVKAYDHKSLIKTSSGKIARLPNLEFYLSHKNKSIHVLGCSHIYSFNQSNELYNQDSCSKNIFLKQIPVVSAQNIITNPRKEEVESYIQTLNHSAIVLFYFGEQDIRTYIPFLIRKHKMSVANAVSHIIHNYQNFINSLKKLRPDLQYAWIVPPPPGKGLAPHPRFVNQSELSNECYYHFLDTELHRKSYAIVFKKSLPQLGLPIIDIWPQILTDSNNLEIDPKYVMDYSHLKNVKALFEREISKIFEVEILETRNKPKHSKVILVVENIEHEMKNLLKNLFDLQIEEDFEILTALNSLHIVELVQNICDDYEVKFPNNWMDKSQIASFSKLCDFVLQHRKQED